MLISESFQTNREKYAWAAGLFNGEGSTYLKIANKKDPYIAISIGQKNREVLDIFHEIFEFVGTVSNPDKFDCHRFRCSGAKAEEILEKMAPWLSIEKASQYEQVRARMRIFRLEHYASVLGTSLDKISVG